VEAESDVPYSVVKQVAGILKKEGVTELELK